MPREDGIMDNTGYIALSNMLALQRRMEVVANNMANMNTGAYQGQSVLFEAYLYKDVETPRKTAFVQDVGVVRDLAEGPLTQTGNQLDVSIHGRGYLAVQTPGGTRYTRQGGLRIDPDGQIATREGFKVLDANGAPIAMGPRDKTINISADGSVSSETGPKGKIALYSFANEQQLRAEGNGTLLPLEGQTPQANPPRVSLVQGMIEGSNVQPIVEMTRMIEVQRQYESAVNLQSSIHELRRRYISTVGKS
jgi:flagellar basal-body rod protein FlgF